jgi:hypothetical protein
MTFAQNDFDRRLFADADDVPGVRGVKTMVRYRAMRFIRDRTYEELNQGKRDPVEIEARVLRETEMEFGTLILAAVLMALVSFIVTRILERIFPKD